MATNTIGNTTFNSNNGNYTVTTGNQTATLNPSGNGSYTTTINGITYSVKVNANTDVSTFSIGQVSFTANGADGYSVSGTAPAGTTGATVNVQLNLDSDFNVSNVKIGATAPFGSVNVTDDFNSQGIDLSSNTQANFNLNIPGVGTISGTFGQTSNATSPAGLGIGNPFTSSWNATYSLKSNGTAVASGNSSGGMTLTNAPDGSQLAFTGNTGFYLPTGNGDQGLILLAGTSSTGA